jgi:serine/threonine protein kinase
MSTSLGENKEFVEDFKREARSAAKLNHPNIAQIYAVGENKGLNYIVMEYVPGNRLDQMIEPDKPLDQAVVLKIGIDIASGLQDASKINLIHSDIKPENILLDKDNNAKLIDFGIASFDGVNKVENNEIWGTPYYISPEKVKKETLDVRSDMYSLGTTLYHALAGIPPFEGETPNDVVAARFKEDPRALHEIRPYIHSDVERIIHKMMQLEPADRYPTYKELIKEMTETLEKLTGVRVEIPKSSIKDDRPHTTSKKKLVFKKSGSHASVNTRQEPAQPAEEEIKAVTPVRSGKKIVMKKRGAKTLSVPRPKVDNVNIDETDDENTIELNDAEKEAPVISDFMASMVDGDKKKKKKNKKPKSKTAKIVTIVLLSIFIPLILGGSIVGFVIYKGIKTVANEMQVQLTYISDKESKIYVMQESMQKVVDRIKIKDTEVTAEVKKSIEIVCSITGERLIIPALVLPEPIVAEPTPLVAEPTNQVTAVDSNVVEVTPAIEVTPEVDMAFGDTDVVQEKHESVKKLEEQFEVSNDIKLKLIEAEALVTSVDDLLKGAKSGTNTVTTTTIDETYKKAVEQANKIGALEARVVKDCESIQRSTISLNKMYKDYQLNTADQKAAEELAAKQAAEKLAKEEAEAAKQRQIENDTEQVRMARIEVDQLIKENDYEYASRKINRAVRKSLKTKEGKDFLKYQEDRLQYLKDYKAFLIKQFKKAPLTLSSMPEVTDASTIGIKIGGKTVPWSKVKIKQMLAFGKFYLGDPNSWTTPETNKLKLRELTKMRLALAIYCYEIGGVQAYPLAKAYADQAVSDLPNYKDDAENMMPEIFETDDTTDDIF